jgi:hypothetical protein
MEEALGELLRLSLVAWGVAGQVCRGGDGALLVLAGDTRIEVRRAPAPLPFRWVVRGVKLRGAMSVAGVLRAVRALLDPGHRPAGLLVGSLPPVPSPPP